MFRRRSTFSDLLIVLVLGLGLSSCVVFWTVYSPYYLDPTPGLDGDRIVRLSRHARLEPKFKTFFAATELDALRKSPIFDAVGALREAGRFVLEGERRELVSGAVVDADFFRVFDCHVREGSVFAGAGERSVVLSWDFRASHFPGGSTVVGKTVKIDGQGRTVTGVLEPVFWPQVLFSTTPQFFLPVERVSEPEQPDYDLVAKLADGAGPAEALSVARRVNDEIQLPFVKNDLVPEVATIDQQVRAQASWFPFLFSGGLVLLCGVCANLATLMVGRTIRTLDDWAIRRALGATNRDFQWQLAKRFFPLAISGALVGLVLARLLLAVVSRFGTPQAFPLEKWRVGIDLLPLLLILVAVASVVCLVPTFLVVRRTDLAPLLSHRQASGGRNSSARSFAFAQLTLAVALAVASTAVCQHYWRKRTMDLGFEREGLSLVAVATVPGRERATLPTDFDRLREALMSEPGVEDVAGSNELLLLLGGAASGEFALGPSFENRRQVHFRQVRVTPNFFSVIGMSVKGKGFEGTVGDGDVVVSQSLAKALWGEESLNESFLFGRKRYRVVGVADDRVANDLSGRDLPTVYYPLQVSKEGQWPFLVVRGARNGRDLETRLPEILASLPSRPVLVSVRSVEDVFATILTQPRFLSTVLLFLSFLVLASTALGLAGAYTREMSQRRREIAIRQALGGTTWRIARQIGLSVYRFAAPAILLGVAGGGWFVSGTKDLLGVENPGYVPVLAIAAGLGVLISLVVVFPIARGARQDPGSLLRF